MSSMPTLQEVTQEASERGAISELPENAQDLMVPKRDSNARQSCSNLEPAEADLASWPSDTGPSIWPMDIFNAVTSGENTACYTGENANRGFIEAPSSLEQAGQRESSHKNVEYGPNMDSGRLHEAHASSQPLDTCSDSLVDSNTRSLYNSAEVAVSPTENGVCFENVFDDESKALGRHTSIGISDTFIAFEENFADFSKQQMPNQAGGVAVVVSTDLDGWQRFDSEENDGSGVFGYDQDIHGESLQKRELWEQLLEAASENSEIDFRMSTSQGEADTGIDSALYGGNQFWLASPGNPFIEGLDRLSNFSEADHCATNAFIAESQLLDISEADIGLLFKEGPSHTDRSIESFLQNKLVEGNLGTQSNGLYDHGNSHHPKPRFPSFSDIRRSSSKSRDPSFASCVEQVPAFQADNYVYGIENGGEKWEANFDSVVPATQEGPRSLSLPREAGDTKGQREKQTFSFFSKEAPVMLQSKPSGFSSPKLSPIVTKVVNKAWTKTEQVENAVRCGKGSNTKDREPKKWIWRCCICCSHVN